MCNLDNKTKGLKVQRSPFCYIFPNDAIRVFLKRNFPNEENIHLSRAILSVSFRNKEYYLKQNSVKRQGVSLIFRTLGGALIGGEILRFCQ